MNPQELENKIEELSSKIDSLTNKLNFIDNKTEIYRNDPPLDRYLDEDSKKIMEQVIRRFYLKTENTVAAGFTLSTATRYHKLTGTASRTSDTTTAIDDGIFTGQILIIEGTDDTNTIIIKDNANTKMAGDVTLGVNDTLTLMWNDTDWIEISRSNN